jgi:DNA invertase Pin-like site-specific DNA recombinase
MTIWGYARVSTSDQDFAGQVEALKVAGADKVFAEKMTGANADRPQLAKLMAGLKAGDVILVTKIDRLGRSTRDLFNLIGDMRKAGANFKSLGDEMLDTTSANGELVFTILAAIATYERKLIQRAEAVKRRAAGETLAEIAKSYAVDVSTISRLKGDQQCALQ